MIKPDFTALHYPCHWHYDMLFGLKVLAEAGFIADERCADALDLLATKQLPDGGFPAEKKYYRMILGNKPAVPFWLTLVGSHLQLDCLPGCVGTRRPRFR